MSDLIAPERLSRVCCVLTATLICLFASVNHARAAEEVETYKDENGWKLLVNGDAYYVKGVVWGYSPRNQNYTYNLWGESDDFIRKVLDYDFGLMKAAGANTIRSFAMIPPKWITYIYREHGIRSVVNPLMGRYGYTVGGRWIPFTDYSDPLTRQTLKRDTLELIEQYKDVEGVLMFALGNESNYGLSWSSFEIENLPVGEQQAAKARYLYSLFNEVMEEGKKISDKPFSIVNGDIQYIDLIAELCPALDVLGSNVYRGPSFTDLWSEVDRKLDLPVVFYEFGSDAFNAREFREDQRAQATVLRDQWKEMYNKAYGNGQEGNSIGGFVFEWRDEWWKYQQDENLDIQDNNASWSNQAYMFDWAPGQNNMNEEWFGITALGPPNADGVYTARPRMAYDVLSFIFSLDPYADGAQGGSGGTGGSKAGGYTGGLYDRGGSKAAGGGMNFNQAIDEMDMDVLALKGDVRLLKAESEEKKRILHFTGGTLRAEYLIKGESSELDELGEEGLEFDNGEMAFLDFGFQPTNNIEGQFTLNILGNVADKEPLEIAYGRRGFPLEVVAVQDFPELEQEFVVLGTTELSDRERIEFYDFSATYQGENFDLETFYHTPRFHWGYEGDFYGLMWEATDLAGQDIWNAKAPQGVEVQGKKGWLKGLTVVGGPEIYWGANPKVMLKYSNKLGNRVDWTFIHSEDVARLEEGVGATQATIRQESATTLQGEIRITDRMSLTIGGIIGATERIDETFTRLEQDENGEDIVVLDEIDFRDTLGIKAKLDFPVGRHLGYVHLENSGLVANGGNPLREFGTRLPLTGLGGKRQIEAGVMLTYNYWTVFPRLLYREQLVDANPSLESSINGTLEPGLGPRNREDDPFAILDQRDARSGELFITYDPTGATPFYQWDNDVREDAKFTFNVAMNYTAFPTPTDSYQFFFEPEGTNAAFGVGLPSEDVWELSTRWVINPASGQRYIMEAHGGRLQSTGDPEGGSRDFQNIEGKMIFNNRHIIEARFRKDFWGPYDFHRQFNLTFPEQYKLEYSILLDSKRDPVNSTQVGVRALYRTVDENSPDNEFLDGDNDYLFSTLFYFLYNFGGTPPPRAIN